MSPILLRNSKTGRTVVLFVVAVGVMSKLVIDTHVRVLQLFYNFHCFVAGATSPCTP